MTQVQPERSHLQSQGAEGVQGVQGFEFRACCSKGAHRRHRKNSLQGVADKCWLMVHFTEVVGIGLGFRV